MPITPTKFIWMDGRFVKWRDARVHVLTHALLHGTGVFEGLRCYPTPQGPAIFRLKDHVARLFQSARTYSMEIPYTEKELIAVTKELIRKNGLSDCYIRALVFCGYGEMSLNPLKSIINVALAAWPWDAFFTRDSRMRGITCKISKWRRPDARILPPYAKATANYANSALAETEAEKNGCGGAIQLNLKESVAEGPGENIFIVKRRALLTPPPSAGILLGITRDSLIRIARDEKMKCEERDITRAELLNADEAFFSGTAVEVIPIREIDGKKIGKGGRGPLTEKLQKKFSEVARGKDKKYYGWLDFLE
ncbi:MAG: branched-chain amino acid transaminase [Candidatus Micrarchaeota archaeon]